MVFTDSLARIVVVVVVDFVVDFVALCNNHVFSNLSFVLKQEHL